MGVKFTNNAMTVSTTALSTTDTVIALPATHGVKFPVLGTDDWFPLTVVDTAGNLEIMRVTARSGDVLTVSRAQEGTAACAFNPGAILSHRATAASFEAVRTGAVDQTARDAAAVADDKAASAQNTADAAKSSADSSVKTVNGVAPVSGNVTVSGGISDMRVSALAHTASASGPDMASALFVATAECPVGSFVTAPRLTSSSSGGSHRYVMSGYRYVQKNVGGTWYNLGG